MSSIEDALKAAIKIYKANPVEADETAAFSAAYGNERDGMGGMMAPSRPPRKPRGGMA